ncbi:ABC transporter permease [Paucilactobacillus kaifaensis]|uniref:ABC transporter permease n=1 Tax=Paucilactobacillus kaifaensis TaxID=2559921 RepID=UPI0010FA2AAC|nr:iron export ABC transporter permease subunit FetB [Paucilactobacillus kaifaensis]
MSLDISNLSLVLVTALVFIALWIGYREQLGIDKDIVIGVIRAVIQLTIVGYVLKYIFHLNNILLTLLLILIIIFNAADNARKRSNGIRGAFYISFVAILSSTVVVLGVLVASGAIKMIPSQIIPISGMVASNSMVAIGLCYRNMNAMFRDQRQQVLERLALGADIKNASKGILRETIKTGMSPTIDSAKTVGLVSLPGMMSGLIIAGVDPVNAIKYQIMVTFMMLATTSLGSVIACYMIYRKFYNDRMQLK